jgi:hypothetical protein
MDDETLERLVIDDALGALPDDARALLAGYLESRPPMAARAAAIREAVALARSASPGGPHAPLPPFPAERLRRSAAAARRRRLVVRAAAAAACLLLGWAAGRGMAGRESTPPASAPMDAAPAQTGVRAPSPDRPVPWPPALASAASSHASEFWSARRIAEQARRVQPASPRIEWTTPVEQPRLKE